MKRVTYLGVRKKCLFVCDRESDLTLKSILTFSSLALGCEISVGFGYGLICFDSLEVVAILNVQRTISLEGLIYVKTSYVLQKLVIVGAI